MAPKRQRTRVTFVKAVKSVSGTKVRKRKKRNSGDQTSGKRPRRDSTENEVMRLKKGKAACPLQAEVIQHIERCIDTAVLSVLSRKKVPAFEQIQGHLARLKQRLLKHCKNMKVPGTKLGKLRDLARDVQAEQQKVREYEDTLELLDDEIEEAAETANQIEESTAALREQVKTLEGQAAENAMSPDQLLNKDPLPLPQGTFKAPTMHDQVKKLENPKLIVKELSEIQSSAMYKSVRSLLQTSYAEIPSTV
ncbi:centromere protein Q-like [Rhinoderma darwinii]|uniref:centromere protein Q-like n=1 Tax=Rhinoderma darwinii TaxID=43563 RepID=UPI003F665228